MDPDELRRHIAYKRDIERSLSERWAQRMLAWLDDDGPADYEALLHDAKWGHAPEVLFHTAPCFARNLILEHGLQPALPAAGNHAAQLAGGVRPDGVYLAAVPDERGVWSHWDCWDIWAVNNRGDFDLDLEDDDLNPECWYVASTIGPDAVLLYAADQRHGV